MKRKKHHGARSATPGVQVPGGQVQMTVPQQRVPSFLDRMADGNEYGSVVSLVPGEGMDFTSELRRAIGEIETIRNRPCICYAANLIKRISHTSIEAADHLPFNEAVAGVPTSEKELDVFLVTPGGSGEQVNLFVEALRRRFVNVQFIIPYKAMSAGTLWALSGDAIWMDSRAFLGPLDPQVPTSDGTFAPAQALLILLAQIQKDGADKLAKGQQPDWTHIALLQKLDQQKLGYALSASKYVIEMAAQYLQRYKFKTWDTHRSTGAPVTADDRKARATDVAEKLCAHDRWKAHGHAISREVLWDELQILVDHIESVSGLERAVRRTWALWYYMFDKMPVAKAILSKNYSYFRFGKES